MRSLAQPRVLKSAGVAALITSALCCPRLMQWHERRYSVWYLATLLVLGGTVLWAFVFAWYEQYTRRPVFTLKVGRGVFAAATAAGVAVALAQHWLVDPWLRARVPQDYPANLGQWSGMTLFSLAFTQLFLVFAPLSWLLRLTRGRAMAVPLTVLFGALVMMAKHRGLANPLPAALFTGLLAARLAQGLVSVYFFLRGGAALVWWWSLLILSRHLLALAGG